MNYIKLLHAAFSTFYFDDRLNPTHISLYMALFQEWNSSRFAATFHVNRNDLMCMSKIGSKSTYHRCITELHEWNYLSYAPSNNPYKGSKISMAVMLTKEEQASDGYSPILEQLAEQYYPGSAPVQPQNHPMTAPEVSQDNPKNGQAVVSTKNTNKPINHIQQPKDRQTVLQFFIEKGFDTEEGTKYYDHYNARDWKTGDGSPINDWRALANHWMNRAKLFTAEREAEPKKAFQATRLPHGDHLRTTKSKDYGQPL